MSTHVSCTSIWQVSPCSSVRWPLHFIEITTIGDAGLAGLKVGSEQAKKQTRASLRESAAVAKKDYMAHAEAFNKDDSEYIKIDIDEAREIVKPLGQ